MVQKPLYRLSQRKAGPLKADGEHFAYFIRNFPITIRSLNRASPIRKSPGKGATAPTMENSCVPAAGRRTACAFPETCLPFPRYSAPSIPRRNPWSCASISSRPTPGPGRWWRTSAPGAALPLLPPSTRAAVLYALKQPRPFMPPPASASIPPGCRWSPGRKECNYRRLFYHLCRSPLAVPAE